jgi:glycosyltransferase involved in cell wall biosynthesis
MLNLIPRKEPFGSFNKHEVELDGTLLSGIFTIKNAIKGGYPFMECILSVLPFCDKILLNDGGSTDETKEYLVKLKEMWPEKINLYNIPDKFNTDWKSIDHGLNRLIRECKSKWIFEIQGDEIIDPVNAKKMIRELKLSDRFNSIRNSRLDLDFSTEDVHYDMRTIRIVKNIPNLSSYTGGDNFHIGRQKSPREGYTLHNVPPERDVSSFVLKHYIRCFPLCVEEWIRRHAIDLASDNVNRISFLLSRDQAYRSPLSAKDRIPNHVPNILRDMVGQDSYYVRDELFDPNWLERVTGISYRLCI